MARSGHSILLAALMVLGTLLSSPLYAASLSRSHVSPTSDYLQPIEYQYPLPVPITPWGGNQDGLVGTNDGDDGDKGDSDDLAGGKENRWNSGSGDSTSGFGGADVVSPWTYMSRGWRYLLNHFVHSFPF
jgi:hypothetical protein